MENSAITNTFSAVGQHLTYLAERSCSCLATCLTSCCGRSSEKNPTHTYALSRDQPILHITTQNNQTNEVDGAATFLALQAKANEKKITKELNRSRVFERLEKALLQNYSCYLKFCLQTARPLDKNDKKELAIESYSDFSVFINKLMRFTQLFIDSKKLNGNNLLIKQNSLKFYNAFVEITEELNKIYKINYPSKLKQISDLQKIIFKEIEEIKQINRMYLDNMFHKVYLKPASTLLEKWKLQLVKKMETIAEEPIS